MKKQELTKVFTVQVKSRFINNILICIGLISIGFILQFSRSYSKQNESGFKVFIFHDYKILWKLTFNNSKIVIKAYNMKIKLVEHKQHKIRPTW